eukprot:jgi/Tetstr1/428498/TSEL_018509.t1
MAAPATHRKVQKSLSAIVRVTRLTKLGGHENMCASVYKLRDAALSAQPGAEAPESTAVSETRPARDEFMVQRGEVSPSPKGEPAIDGIADDAGVGTIKLGPPWDGGRKKGVRADATNTTSTSTAAAPVGSKTPTAAVFTHTQPSVAEQERTLPSGMKMNLSTVDNLPDADVSAEMFVAD